MNRRRFTILFVALAFAGAPPVLARHTVGSGQALLTRRYHDGETLTYRMTGLNQSTRYRVLGKATVRRNRSGHYVESWQWSDLAVNGTAVALSAASRRFRQSLSLDPHVVPSLPDLSAVDPWLIGPITDTATFYSDLWLAEVKGRLLAAGNHFYDHVGTPSSWADGTRTILGQTSIDFDITLTAVDAVHRTAILRIRHIPPKKPQVHLPANWMKTAVTDSPNNWVQVTRTSTGYRASVGRETFDVQIEVDLRDGKILSAGMENVVQTLERDCTDKALTNCDSARPRRIHRRIEMRLDSPRR